MKKLLAMTLALVLVLGLAVPALAEEALDPFYTVDGEPVEAVPISDDLPVETTPIFDEIWTDEEGDPYAEYEAAHPEEFENMDMDALIAGWGYQDITAQEQFMEYEGWQYDTLEEAVKNTYIDNRIWVENICQEALEYRAEYPEEWESFDADAFFANVVRRDWDPDYQDVAHYMAYYNILTEEEFVDDMFVWYMDDYYGTDYIHDKDEEPTLTLMVNGVASDVAIAVNDWTTYADAADLRAVLGDEAVGQGYEGPVPIREAAENMGWDVSWYDGGWYGARQEVQLWDKAAFEAELDEEFGPLNDFLGRLMTMSRDMLTTQEAISGKETVDVTLTRFSTLDGNKDYKLKFTVDYVAQNAVIDMTVTFDASQLLQMVSPADLARLGRGEMPSLEQLTGLLKAGKMEFLVDYDLGVVAYNIPLLGLLDEDLAGWQTEYLYGWEDTKEALLGDGELSFVSTLYASMVSQATSRWNGGAEKALDDYKQNVGGLGAFLGKDRFTTSGGTITYSLTTQAVNQALAEALELQEPDKASFFKVCEITYTLDARDNVNMKLHIRPDMEGISAAMAADQEEDGYFSFFGVSSLIEMVLGALDMDVTATGWSSQTSSSSQVSIHWNNVGKLDMKSEATLAPTTRSPRKLEELERSWVYATEPAAALDQGALGLAQALKR